MNEAWVSIFRKCIDSYNAIQTLKENVILDEEEVNVCEHNLLFNIVVMMKSEMGE